MDDLLKSVRTVFSEAINHGKKFIVPSYQRGYKWNRENIFKLLDDLKSFEKSNMDKPNSFYCIQNITIVPIEDESGWNVVDGQQRLTTIYILLSYLRKYYYSDTNLAFFSNPDSLKYNVREETGKYLKENVFTGIVWDSEILPDSAKLKDQWYILDVAKGIKDWFNEKVKPWFTKEKWQELGRQAMQSIRNGLNSISLPKFHFYWETTGYTGSFFGRTFTVNIPFPHLDWYAKGGVFDGASVIGVGEAGKEAVVPLEKNTQWINLVVDGVIERLKSSGVADQLAAAFASIPTPVMAGGTIVPPNSVGSADSMGNIADALNEIRALLSGDGQNNTPEFRFYLDGKELHATVRKYDRQYSVAQGV